MNADEITSALQSNGVTRHIFNGVCAADEVPIAFSVLPASCVVNTDTSDEPGQHWIALFQAKASVLEYFNWYGNDPAYHKLELHPLIASNRLVKQDYLIQSDLTTVCGQYAMFFVYNRCIGKSYSDILKLFSKDIYANDRMVQLFVNRTFQLKTPLTDVDFLLS